VDSRARKCILVLDKKQGEAVKVAWVLVAFVCSVQLLWAQTLSPRAYLITPLHSNAITLSYSFYDGSLRFNGQAPITGATGTYSIPSFSYYHSFSFFGRSANVLAALPYGVGTFQGTAFGQERKIYRSGLLDSGYRLSVNLKGGPAMQPQHFAKWKQKALLGASLFVIAPTGQYDPTKLINWSINRWAFKPEFGYSERWGHWVLDAYAGAWFFTTNPQYLSSVPNPVTEQPIGSFEGHLSYDFKKPGLWTSLDGNFWFGGTTSANGIEETKTRQTSSRIGVTAAIPVSKHQAVKVSYSAGTFDRFGGNYQDVSVAWAYYWLGRPK